MGTNKNKQAENKCLNIFLQALLYYALFAAMMTVLALLFVYVTTPEHRDRNFGSLSATLEGFLTMYPVCFCGFPIALLIAAAFSGGSAPVAALFILFRDD